MWKDLLKTIKTGDTAAGSTRFAQEARRLHRLLTGVTADRSSGE
ncbi:hypothetical protein ACBI99_23560 [Nonomuraea sp. ATR24]